MSGVSAVRFILANNAALVALVPAAKIFVGVVPLNTVLPAIAVTQISGVPHLTVSMRESGRIETDRVQVTVLTKTYQTNISAAVLAALPNQSGSVNGVRLDSLLPDGVGPDLYDDAAVVYERSRDFIARWHGP
jgi:hypothetical protein